LGFKPESRWDSPGDLPKVFWPDPDHIYFVVREPRLDGRAVSGKDQSV
jgi:hypothetical protein